MIEPPSGSSRLQQGGLLVLIVGSAITIPLAEVGGTRLTGDRLLGLAAVAVAALLAISGGLRWTPIHTALAAFVAVQIACSLLNAEAWLPGLKLVTVYVLGFACFALTATWAAALAAQRWAKRVWIGVGISVGLLGAAAGVAANLTQTEVWGAGIAQNAATPLSGGIQLFAGRATFAGWNFLCSFLLIPFSLALWSWPGRGDWDRRSWIGLGIPGAPWCSLSCSASPARLGCPWPARRRLVVDAAPTPDPSRGAGRADSVGFRGAGRGCQVIEGVRGRGRPLPRGDAKSHAAAGVVDAVAPCLPDHRAPPASL